MHKRLLSFEIVEFYVYVTLHQYHDQNKFIHHFEVVCKIFQVGSLTWKGQGSGAKEHLEEKKLFQRLLPGQEIE